MDTTTTTGVGRKTTRTQNRNRYCVSTHDIVYHRIKIARTKENNMNKIPMLRWTEHTSYKNRRFKSDISKVLRSILWLILRFVLQINSMHQILCAIFFLTMISIHVDYNPNYEFKFISFECAFSNSNTGFSRSFWLSQCCLLCIHYTISLSLTRI